MFHGINKYFEKKKSLINKFQNKDQEINNYLKIFLNNEFGENLKGFSFLVQYNLKDNSLTITPENKILTNELALRITDLSEFLKSKKITLNRILIR